MYHVDMHKVFELVVSRAGSIAKLKKDLEAKSIQHVANWQYRGIPVRYVAVIHRLYGIPIKKLRPDDWADFWPSGTL